MEKHGRTVAYWFVLMNQETPIRIKTDEVIEKSDFAGGESWELKLDGNVVGEIDKSDVSSWWIES